MSLIDDTDEDVKEETKFVEQMEQLNEKLEEGKRRLKAGMMSRKEAKKLLKLSNLKLKIIAKRKKELTQKIGKLKHLREIADFLGEEGQKNYSSMEEFEQVELNDTSGIYIVSKNQGSDVEMTKFYDLIRGDGKPFRISLPGILDKNLVNEDGDKTNLRPGDLVSVKYLPKFTAKEAAFHLTNVAPGDEKAAVQYEYALSKLGLGVAPKFDKALLAIDGQFRKLLTETDEGKQSS